MAQWLACLPHNPKVRGSTPRSAICNSLGCENIGRSIPAPPTLAASLVFLVFLVFFVFGVGVEAGGLGVGLLSRWGLPAWV